MSTQAMTAIVAAVAFAAMSARDVRPADAARHPLLRETLQVSEPLPPGHPPIPGHGGLPEGHPPIDQAYPALPEGHPPIPWAQPGCPAPHGMPDETIDAGFDRDEWAVIST